MLIYLASYPRSGNTLVANLIAHYLGIDSSSSYRGEGRGHGEIEVAADGRIDAIFVEYVDRGTGRITRGLLDGIGEYLTDDLRADLSSAKETFFLKTHELPQKIYFDGEWVVHIVRHPGAAFWSYWHFLSQMPGASLSLEKVIEGRAFPGSWSHHSASWIRAAAGLGQRYLRLRYEDAIADDQSIVHPIAQLIGRTPREAAAFPDFNYWHGVDPDFYRSGNADEWSGHYSGAQKALLWVLHGLAMSELGYSLDVGQGGSGRSETLPGLAGLDGRQHELLELIEGLRDNIARLQEESDKLTVPGSTTRDMNAATYRELESKQAAIEWLQSEVASKQKGIEWLTQEVAGKQKGIDWLQRELAEKEARTAWLARELASERERVRALRGSFERRPETVPPPARSNWLRSALLRLGWTRERSSPPAKSPPFGASVGPSMSDTALVRRGSPAILSPTPAPSTVVPAVASSPLPHISSDDALRAEVRKYTFYHIIKLSESVSTPGVERYLPIQQRVLEAMRGLPWEGRKVLDIGCRDGLFALEAEKRGAATVIGVDNAISRGAVEVVLPFLHSRVAMYEGNLFDLRRETFGPFDVVLFAGVLYHLRYPFWGLKIVRDLLVDGGTLLLETALWHGQPDMAALWCPTESASPYESTSVSFFNEKGLRDTLDSLGFVVLSSSVLPGGSESVVKTKWGGITRACFVCRYVEGAQSPRLRGYWDGLHSEH